MSTALRFLHAMDLHADRTLTEKGSVAISEDGMQSPLVALFYRATRGESEIAQYARRVIDDATLSTHVDLCVLTWQTRATRNEGKGEKKLFYELLKTLPKEAVLATLHLLPKYGYWKDAFQIMATFHDPDVDHFLLQLMSKQLRADERELADAIANKRNPQLSLLAKYAPREKSAFDKSLKAAKRLSDVLYPHDATSKAKYRRLIATLNKQIDPPEIKMCDHRWAEIDHTKVPSRAMMRNRKAFLNETVKGRLRPHETDCGNRFPDDVDRVDCRLNLLSTVATKKIHGSQGGPNEFVSKVLHADAQSSSDAAVLNAQWSDLFTKLKSEIDSTCSNVGDESVIDPRDGIAMCDVSRSMYGEPMHAAIALAILVSELGKNIKDRVLTFESTPQWVDLKGLTFCQKVCRLRDAGWGGSTNFQSACEMVLQAAVDAKLPREHMIKKLFVFSDMQFDEAGGGGYFTQTSPWETQYEKLKVAFRAAGIQACGEPYDVPQIVFWNLRANTPGYPVTSTQKNTQLVSGFSAGLLKIVMGAKKIPEQTTPEETVRAALDDPTFDDVRRALSGISEGVFAPYVFPVSD